jgi:uncharacterized GH25 family protein
MKPLILAHKCALIILSLCLVASVSTVHGHEFILKPAKFQAQPGGKIPFSVVAAHVFMLSDAMEPIDTVKAWPHQGAKSIPVVLRENPKQKTLDGEAVLSVKGTALLVGHLEEPVDSRPAKDGRPAVKIKREKWSKAILSGGAPDEHYGKIFGHTLEIVPLANPLSAKTNSELSFRICSTANP